MIRTNPIRNEPISYKITLHIQDLINGLYYKLEENQWITIGQLKKSIEKRIGLSSKIQRLFSQGYEMKNSKYLIDFISDEETEKIDRAELLKKYKLNYYKKNLKMQIIQKAKNSLEIQLITKLAQNLKIGRISQIKELSTKKMENSIKFIQEGFNKGLKPLKIEIGVSGSYFLRDRFRNNEAIFKSIDEEPFAPNNKKGYKGKFGEMSFRKGIRSGEVCIREVAAYYLDLENVHGVPSTTLVEIYHPFFLDHFESVKHLKAFKQFGQNGISKNFFKRRFVKRKTFKSKFIDMINDCFKRRTKIGSLQKFEIKNGNAGDISSSKFSDYEVQKIALLDLRVLNDDRNGDNILYKKIDKNYIQLIPIDHGLILPDNLEINNFNICWYFWKQIKKPICEKLKKFIKKLNPHKNALMLKKKLDLRTACLVNFMIAEIFLKKCVFENMNIFEIVNLVYREDDEVRSPLERIVEKSEFIFLRLENSFLKSHFYFSNILKNNYFSNFYDNREKKKNDQLNLPKIRKRIYSINLKNENFVFSPEKKSKNFNFLYKNKNLNFSEKKNYGKTVNLPKINKITNLQKSFSFSEIDNINSFENTKNNDKDKFFNILFFYYFDCCVDNFLCHYKLKNVARRKNT